MDISFGTTIMDVTRYANVPDTTLARRRVEGTHILRTQFGSVNVIWTSIYFNVRTEGICMRGITTGKIVIAVTILV